MIKLLPLLLESNIRWDALKKIREDYNPLEVEEAIQAASNMGRNTKVLWRNAGSYPLPVNTINNPPRTTFRGSELGAITILKELSVTNPTFVFPDSRPHYVFGNYTYVVILKEPYKLYQSTKIDDVMAYAQRNIYKGEEKNGGYLRTQIGTRTEDEIVERAKEGAKTYRDVSDGNLVDNGREIIVQTEKYWLVSPTAFKYPELVGKFGVQDIKEFGDDTTYNDVIFALEKYKKNMDSYRNWLSKRQK